jgi:hypothetical protein
MQLQNIVQQNNCLNFNHLGELTMKDSTAFILTSVGFNILTIAAAVIGAPIPACAVLCFAGVMTMGLGFYNLAKYN